MYRIVVTEQARKDYLYWRRSGNAGVLKKIADLLEDIAAEIYVLSMRHHYSK
jgi:toxin YoeB